MSDLDDPKKIGGAATFASGLELDGNIAVVGQVDNFIFGVLSDGRPFLPGGDPPWDVAAAFEWAITNYHFYSNIAAKLGMFAAACRRAIEADSANAKPSKPSPESEKSAND